MRRHAALCRNVQSFVQPLSEGIIEMSKEMANRLQPTPQHHPARLITQDWLARGLGITATLLLWGGTALPAWSQTLSEKVLAMERDLEQEFETYFGLDLADVDQPLEAIAQTLAQLDQATGTKAAVLWVIPRGDHLHLVLLTAKGEPIVRDLYDVPDATLRRMVNQFHLETHSSPNQVKMTAAQQLYQWIIAPYADDYLTAEGIDTLLFCLGNGVRSLPLAAFHDGEQFLIEKYNVTRIPAFNLIETDYVELKRGTLLAMGASEFQDQAPLPAIPTELTNILWELRSERPPQTQWQGQSFLNQDFTLSHLRQQVTAQRPTVVHLATHAAFQPGQPDQSYIQFWDSQLTLDQARQVAWNNPPLELLVLSACRTAIGDDQAELGFAGLALKAGVKSALASLWNVNDKATLVLMSEFYRQLGTTSTKAAALRQAQLRMLRGEVRAEGDHLLLSRGPVPLPETLSDETVGDLSAPYYWAGFTLISSPW